MRIAVSGTHFSGKSTLIAALVAQLPHYAAIDEPYFLLEQEGYSFSHPPSLEDFERQFQCSIEVIQKSRKDTIFDRCPLDCLAYAQAVAEMDFLEGILDTDLWIQRMEEAVKLLDLIVFIPIEQRDRIFVPRSEDLALRASVDEKLQEMLFNDPLEILENREVLEVVGSLEKRVKMVKAHLISTS